MSILSPGSKSSEFILIVLYMIYIVATSTGVISPVKVAAIQAGVPAALDVVSNVVNNFGDQTLLGGLVLAYLRRRFNLKKEDIDAMKLKLQADIEKYKAVVATRGNCK